MSLSSASNTINALGIFGRLEKQQEEYFHNISTKYSKYPENDDAIGIFNHLSLVIDKDVNIKEVSTYIDLLRLLKEYLPIKLKIDKPIIKDGKHIALSFDTKQTEEIRNVAKSLIPDHVVETYYTKVVWYVPEDKQLEVINILSDVKEMVFYDFKLCANRQEDSSTIYSSLKL